MELLVIKRFKNRFCELIPTPARWMLLLLWFLCAVIALLVGPESRGAEKLADGHPDIQIVPENRVANQKTGVCWWACAEMIGNQFDIPQLKGLTTAVIASGIGVHEGASDEALAWWHAKLGIQPDKNPNGKTQDGVAWMRSKLEAGQPVIAGIDMRDRQGQIVKHVWLVTHMSYHPRTWSDGTKDHSIKFIDCNDITKVVEYPWQRFWAAFTGDAWSYDVTPVVGANPLRQGNTGTPLQIAIQSTDFDRLVDYTQKLEVEVARMEGLRDVNLDLEVNKPQLDIRIDREKAATLGISATDIADTLRVLLGGDDATHFRRGNELYDVIVQLEARDRFATSDPTSIYVRTASKDLVPLSNVVKVSENVGPSAVNHYDRKRSVILSANLEGIDLGAAIEKVTEATKASLPPGFSTALAGESREFVRGSRGLSITFFLALAAVFLVLAAQFESFIHPFTIMLALPLATFGALAGLAMFGMTLNVYSFIGLIMLMGLVTKNSILLVDYANVLRDAGATPMDAVARAGRVRLRPILMTAASTIVGIVPVALGLGAGSESRRPLGVSVLIGMTTSTLLTLYVVPVFYTLVESAKEWAARRPGSFHPMMRGRSTNLDNPTNTER